MAGKITADGLRLKRAYEAVADDDGERILVERLWPRGVSKERAHLADWLKEIAPSVELRKWFNHEPAKWPEFQKRYRAELAGHEALLEQLRKRATAGTVTLVYAAHDEEHNAALVLHDMLLGK